MSKELLAAAEAVSNAKLLPREKIFEALEQALITSTKKKLVSGTDISIILDQKTGLFQTFRKWKVVENIENPVREITYDAAKLEKPEIKLGEYIEDEIESIKLDRITLQTVRQVIALKIKEAEKWKEIEQFQKQLNTIINTTVKKVTYNHIIVDLSNDVEGILFKEDWIQRENFRAGDRIRALLYEIKPSTKEAQFLLTRSKPMMLAKLFEIEVPEIAEEIIEIKALARDPGIRSKIAVKSNDKRVDPIGACIGMRGSRVQAITDELSGERIDIVLWSDNPVELAINAMAPADISSIVADEDTKMMDIAVAKENLAQAIGKDGQNVRLASQITGWTLNVMSTEDLEAKRTGEDNSIKELFKSTLGVDDEFAKTLLNEGFTSIQDISYIDDSELLKIEGVDKEYLAKLRDKAAQAIENINITNQEILNSKNFDTKILYLEGMTQDLAVKLTLNNIITIEDLAEQSVDELLLHIKDLHADSAAKLIMDARNICWFSDK